MAHGLCEQVRRAPGRQLSRPRSGLEEDVPKHEGGRYLDSLPARLGGLFPESPFIHILRDGLDVAMSILERPFGPDSMPEAALRWRQAVSAEGRT